MRPNNIGWIGQDYRNASSPITVRVRNLRPPILRPNMVESIFQPLLSLHRPTPGHRGPYIHRSKACRSMKYGLLVGL